MINIIQILLLYNNLEWKEIDLQVPTRDITIEQAYKILPDKYKRKELYKIIKLGHNRLYEITSLNLSENKIDE